MNDAYEPTVYVLLPCAQMEKVDASTVKFVNIEEGMRGEDVYTFVCPKCDEQHKSVAFST